MKSSERNRVSVESDQSLKEVGNRSSVYLINAAATRLVDPAAILGLLDCPSTKLIYRPGRDECCFSVGSNAPSFSLFSFFFLFFISFLYSALPLFAHFAELSTILFFCNASTDFLHAIYVHITLKFTFSSKADFDKIIQFSRKLE